MLCFINFLDLLKWQMGKKDKKCATSMTNIDFFILKSTFSTRSIVKLNCSV